MPSDKYYSWISVNKETKNKLKVYAIRNNMNIEEFILFMISKYEKEDKNAIAYYKQNKRSQDIKDELL